MQNNLSCHESFYLLALGVSQLQGLFIGDSMKTTVLGIRLNDYQREKLQSIAEDSRMTEVEAVRVLIDKLIEGRIQIGGGVDISGLRIVAKQKGVSVQTLIDAVVEQLDERRQL